MNHAEPYEGTGAGCHCEIVAHIEGLSHISPPPKSDGHDEEGQPGEEPVDKKRGIHGYTGVLPGIQLHGPALEVTSEKERLLKRINKDQNEWSRSEIEFFPLGDHERAAGHSGLRGWSARRSRWTHAKILRVKSSGLPCWDLLHGVGIIDRPAARVARVAPWPAQFTGLARVPSGAGREVEVRRRSSYDGIRG